MGNDGEGSPFVDCLGQMAVGYYFCHCGLY
jgi:hypothetical protein